MGVPGIEHVMKTSEELQMEQKTEDQTPGIISQDEVRDNSFGDS